MIPTRSCSSAMWIMGKASGDSQVATAMRGPCCGGGRRGATALDPDLDRPGRPRWSTPSAAVSWKRRGRRRGPLDRLRRPEFRRGSRRADGKPIRGELARPDRLARCSPSARSPGPGWPAGVNRRGPVGIIAVLSLEHQKLIFQAGVLGAQGAGLLLALVHLRRGARAHPLDRNSAAENNTARARTGAEISRRERGSKDLVTRARTIRSASFRERSLGETALAGRRPAVTPRPAERVGFRQMIEVSGARAPTLRRSIGFDRGQPPKIPEIIRTNPEPIVPPD